MPFDDFAQTISVHFLFNYHKYKYMTESVNCTLYYSVPGQPFALHEKDNPELIIATPVTLNVYIVHEDEDETDVAFPKNDNGRKVELSIAHDIEAPQFFCSETFAMLENENGHILNIGERTVFPITLYRNIDRAADLKIKFEENNFTESAEWKPA